MVAEGEVSGLPAEIPAVVKENLASAIWGQNCLITMVALPCLLPSPAPPIPSAQLGGCLCPSEERKGFSSAHFATAV